MISKINDFGFKIVKSIASNGDFKNNVTLCPAGAYLVLANLQIGTFERTQEQLTSLLEENFYESLKNKYDQEKKEIASVMTAINNSSKMNTAIFYGFRLIDSFKKQSYDIFDVDFKNIEFKKSKEALTTVNEWISDKTDGIVPVMFTQEFPPNINFVYINTILFKSDWREKFDKTQTIIDIFKKDSSNKVSVQMMNMTDDFKFYHDEDNKLSVLFIPYLKKNLFAVLIRPDDDTSVKDVANNFKCDDIKNYFSESRMTEINVKIPKFDFSIKIDLKNILYDLGVTDLFTPFVANLSGMTEEQSSVHKMEQAVRLTVDEAGTTACAVTDANICFDGISHSKPINFHLNKPFLFFVYDVSAKLILFASLITDPTANDASKK